MRRLAGIGDDGLRDGAVVPRRQRWPADCGSPSSDVKPPGALSRARRRGRWPAARPLPRAGHAGPRLRPVIRRTFAILIGLVVAGCEAGPPGATPAITPGTSATPREVNIIAKDWIFLPDSVDVVPGEMVVIHVVNGGLEIHEAVIGDAAVQDAWEVAEAATAGSPPGPTPLVSVPPGVSGLRVVVASGQRMDVIWHVPASGGPGLVVGCHIPGHWAKGMVVPIVLASPSPHD
jgi:uncharacterized cupredoxin-like copper-binding protein